MTVGVVILNWNGKKLMQQFLPDVVAFSTEATIYVADNASTDRSVEYLKENFPTVKIIENEINGGYAKGYNDALAKVNEDIFVLLNNDVQVTPHWLESILTTFKEHAAVGAIQPKILDFFRPEYFEYAGAAGGFIDRLGYPYCRGRIFGHLEKDQGQYDGERDIFWASGACLAVRKEAYYKAGALDEDYFAHQEEIDLCWRLHSFGYKVKYISASVVYHMGGGTLNSMHPRKTFYNFRNSLYTLVKNLPSYQVIWIVFIRMILDGVAAVVFLFSGKTAHFFAVLRAHINFYQQIPHLLSKRKKLPKYAGYFSKNSVVCSYYLKGRKKFSEF